MSIPVEYYSPAYHDSVDRVKEIAREVHPPSPRLTLVALGCVAVGILGFVIGILVSPARAWGAFLSSFAFWAGVSQGAIVVACVFNSGFARWGRNVQRFIEPAGLAMVFLPLVYFVMWLGHDYEFRWTHMHGLSPWLNAPAMLWRDELVLVVMLALDLWWLYRSIRADVMLSTAKDRPLKGLEARARDWLIRDWKGEQHEVAWSQAVLRNLAPWIIVGFCWGFGMISIDLTMTVDPKFKSTMLPGIYWVSEFLAPLSLCAVLLWAWIKWRPRATEVITRSNILDLGNMIWGFAIFRTWFDWSQYIIMWYGDLPDEAKYLTDRWRIEPWKTLAYGSLGLMFIAPFVLGFSRTLKKNSGSCAFIGGLVFTGVMARVWLDVLPSVPHLGPTDFGLIEIAITIGFAGLIALPYLWLLKWVPLYPVSDPLFKTSVETRGIPDT